MGDMLLRQQWKELTVPLQDGHLDLSGLWFQVGTAWLAVGRGWAGVVSRPGESLEADEEQAHTLLGRLVGWNISGTWFDVETHEGEYTIYRVSP
jgi:hypothetical protein